MKKTALVLCAVLAATLCLSACGKKQEEQAKVPETTETQTTQATQTVVASYTEINAEDAASFGEMSQDLVISNPLATTTIREGVTLHYQNGSVAVVKDAIGKVRRVIETAVTDTQTEINISLSYEKYSETSGTWDSYPITTIAYKTSDSGATYGAVEHVLAIGSGLSFSKILLNEGSTDREMLPADESTAWLDGEYHYDKDAGLLYVYVHSFPAKITIVY